MVSTVKIVQITVERFGDNARLGNRMEFPSERHEVAFIDYLGGS